MSRQCPNEIICVSLLLATATLLFLFGQSHFTWKSLKTEVCTTMKKDWLSRLHPKRVSYDINLYKDPWTEEGNHFWSSLFGKAIIPGIFDNCSQLFPHFKNRGLGDLPEEFQKHYDPLIVHFNEDFMLLKRRAQP